MLKDLILNYASGNFFSLNIGKICLRCCDNQNRDIFGQGISFTMANEIVALCTLQHQQICEMSTCAYYRLDTLWRLGHHV